MKKEKKKEKKETDDTHDGASERHYRDVPHRCIEKKGCAVAALRPDRFLRDKRLWAGPRNSYA